MIPILLAFIHVDIYAQEYVQRPVASLKIMPSKFFKVFISLPIFKRHFLVHCL